MKITKKQKRENRKKRNNGYKGKCFIENDESYRRQQDYMTSTQSKLIGERPHDILQNSEEYSYHHG